MGCAYPRGAAVDRDASRDFAPTLPQGTRLRIPFAREAIGRMLQPRRRIELVVRVDETETGEERTRGDIVGVVAGEERRRAQYRESVVDDARCGFQRVALSPMARRNVEPELRNLRLALARP